jgi:hypothetical protein
MEVHTDLSSNLCTGSALIQLVSVVAGLVHNRLTYALTVAAVAAL